MLNRATIVLVFLLCGAMSVFAAGGQGESSQTGDEIVKLKMLAGTDKFDPETDYTRLRIKELIGYDIIPEMGNEDDKVNLIVSSGQEYDMIRMANRNLLASFVENEAIHDLTEEIQEHGEYLLKYLPQEIWDMVSNDGRIYAIPTDSNRLIDWGTTIRVDWLEKLGLNFPENPTELREVLMLFKNENPDGIASDKVIPLTIPGANTSDMNFNGVAQAFGIGRSPVSWIVKDGKIVNSVELPGTKEYLTYMNDLYANQLLDIDFPANNRQTLETKVGSGVVGAAYGSVWWTAGPVTLRKANPDAKMEYLPPLLDSEGNRRMERGDGLKNFYIVPKSSRKAEEVVKFANDFMNPAYYKDIILGEEGVHHELRDGKYWPIFPAFNDLNKGRWFYPANATEIYFPIFHARAHKEAQMGSQYDMLQEFLEYAYGDIYRLTPILPEITEYGQPLQAFAVENMMRMVIDEGALSDFDNFVAEWKRRGGDELTQALNDWYSSR